MADLEFELPLLLDELVDLGVLREKPDSSPRDPQYAFTDEFSESIIEVAERFDEIKSEFIKLVNKVSRRLGLGRIESSSFILMVASLANFKPDLPSDKLAEYSLVLAAMFTAIWRKGMWLTGTW